MRLCPFSIAALGFAVLAPRAQQPNPEKAPQLVQAVEFPNGAWIALRYSAIPPPKPGEAAGQQRPIGQLDVRGLVTVGGKPIAPQKFMLLLHCDAKERWSLVAERGGAEPQRWLLPFEPTATAPPRLELVLAAAEKHDEAELRVAFAGGTCRLGIAAAQGPPGGGVEHGAAAPGWMRGGLETAHVEAKSILDVVKLWMVKNPGAIPRWADLIKPDARGNRLVAVDAPKKDPWGNAYVITNDPTAQSPAIVLSWGPDGKEGTADDITAGRSAPARERN